MKISQETVTRTGAAGSRSGQFAAETPPQFGRAALRMKARRPRAERVLARKRCRSGGLTLEAVLILPVLVLTFLAVLQFGILMLVEQTIVHAATVAAREAAKGADVDAVVLSAQSVLSLHGLSVGPAMTLVLEDPLSNDPVQVRGDLPCDIAGLPPLKPGEIRVTLGVSLSHRPFLNALRHCAIDFTGRKFTVSAVAEREFDGQAMITPRPECHCR
ncbi:MAG: TadE/TadG family type IV pilus assembly protein [Thermogutta sp.]